MTGGSDQVERTFSDILSRLSPLECVTLDALASKLGPRSPEDHEPSLIELSSLNPVAIDKLVGLNLLRYTRSEDDENTVSGTAFTDAGWAFVQACQGPGEAAT